MNTQTDSVRIVIFDELTPGNFLVLSEKDDPENFKLPGGKFESDTETPNLASKRELREELGLELEPQNAGELLNDDGISKRFIFSLITRKESLKPSDEIDKIIWVSEETIPEGKNKEHILSAVKLSRNFLNNNNGK